jgi:hypothetical protein
MPFCNFFLVAFIQTHPNRENTLLTSHSAVICLYRLMSIPLLNRLGLLKMTNEMQMYVYFTIVKRYLGEILIFNASKWNFHKQKTKIKCIPTFFVIR